MNIFLVINEITIQAGFIAPIIGIALAVGTAVALRPKAPNLTLPPPPPALPAPTAPAPPPPVVKVPPPPVRATAAEATARRRETRRGNILRSSSRRSILAGETGGVAPTGKKTLLGL